MSNTITILATAARTSSSGVSASFPYEVAGGIRGGRFQVDVDAISPGASLLVTLEGFVSGVWQKIATFSEAVSQTSMTVAPEPRAFPVPSALAFVGSLPDSFRVAYAISGGPSPSVTFSVSAELK